MSDRRPPPRLVDLRTATAILRHTTAIFSTRHYLRTLLILSLLLFSLRTNVENLTRFLTSYIDNDDSIESLLSRIELPPNPASTSTRITATHHHDDRRHPFLQLTRVGTLDGDLISGDEEIDRRLLGNVQNPRLNATSFIIDAFDPQLGFSNSVSDNGIRVSEIVRSGVKLSFRSVTEKEEKINISNSSNSISINSTDWEFFFLWFGFERHELNTLLSLIGALSASYGVMILAFVFTYVWVHGVVFVLVVNELLKNHVSLYKMFQTGAILGSRRLSGFVIMRWVFRDAWTQLLGVFFFGEIEDQYSIFKIFIRLKFMPFSLVTPWVKGFESEIYGFLLSWFLLDMVMSFFLAVDAWVAMADSRKSGKEVIKEGWRLLSLRIHPAINLKCFEGIVCGPFARHILTHLFGKLVASIIQTLMEVYFMVAWMLYYFSVKLIDASCNGTPFGKRELEAMVKDDR